MGQDNRDNKSFKYQSRPIDSLLKRNFASLTRQAKLIYKAKIKTWQALMLVFFLSGFGAAIVWTVSTEKVIISFSQQAGETIQNQAGLTFEDDQGSQYAGTSNMVATNIVQATPTPTPIPTPTPTPTPLDPRAFDFKFRKQGISNYADTVIIRIYQAGTTDLVATIYQTTTADGTAQDVLHIERIPDGTYDIIIKTSYCLTKKLTNVSWPPIQELDFGETKTGNLNDSDDIINSLDWSVMNSGWGTADAISDINGDGIVNTLDWSFMNSNWGQTGE